MQLATLKTFCYTPEIVQRRRLSRVHLFSSELGRRVFSLRWTAWFAGNSKIRDKYGLAASANDWLIRH